MTTWRRAALLGGLVLAASCAVGLALLEASWEPDRGYEDEVERSDPVSWWRLDELEGDVAADSAGADDGRYVGQVRHGVQGPLPDRIDTGAGFQGDAIIVVDGERFPFPGRRPFSVEAWVTPRPPQPAPFTRVISKERFRPGDRRDGWSLYFDDVGGTIGFERRAGLRSQSAVSLERLPDTEYTHLVGTFDGSTTRLYVNGSEVADSGTKRGPSLPETDEPLTLGRLWRHATGQYLGLLDEVAVYDRALDSAEIESHWAAAR